MSTLLFFAIQEGLVKGVEQPIADFGWNLKPKDQQTTFRHLGSMTSGYARPDPPGTAWAYNDFAIQLYQKTLFDRVFEGTPEEASMDPKRFGALQLEDGLSFRKRNRRLLASVRDFARIAWFWLNKGKWHDTQLYDLQFQMRLLGRVCQIPPHPPLAKGGNFRIVSIVTANRITASPLLR